MDNDDQNPPPPPPPPLPSPPPPPPPPPHDDNNKSIVPFPSAEPSNEEDDGYALKLKSFTELMLKSATSFSPTKSLSPELKTLIEKRIEEIFPQLLRTPDHPPYQIMIRDAITSLNEDGGSTAEAISQLIRDIYADLPYAHPVFFQHYLEQLCQNGTVVKAGDRYIMSAPDITPSANVAIISRGNHDEFSPSPSLSSSSSWSSSSDDFPISKRDRMSLRSHRRSRTYHPRAAKRRGIKTRKASEKQIVRMEEPQSSLVPKSMGGRGEKGKSVKTINRGKRKCKVGKEAAPNANILMLEGPKGSEEQTDGKDGRRRALLTCLDPITGKRRTLIDIDLDELEDMVSDYPVEVDSMQGSTEKADDRVVDKKRGSSVMKQDGAVHQKVKASETGKRKVSAKEEPSIVMEHGFKLVNGRLRRRKV